MKLYSKEVKKDEVKDAIAQFVPGLVGDAIRWARHRKDRQKKLQDQVNKHAPLPVKKDGNEILWTMSNDKDIDWASCQKSPMSENEIKEWKTLISTLGNEAARTFLTASAFHGLLRCDVPLKDLYRLKDYPEIMRGFVKGSDGKILQQASFTEADFLGADFLGSVTPLLIYQCLAVVTSQYYLHRITENLDAINEKLDNILKMMISADRATLKEPYNRFVELSGKKTYHNVDQQTVSNCSRDVERIREKYRDLLLKIEHLNVDAKWTDKKEAEAKIKALEDSHYFEYLEIVMQAEFLAFFAAAVSIKVANYLRNDEDVDIYLKRMNLDYWNDYVNQFNQIRHDVVKYLELQAKDSWIQKGTITKMKDEQISRFNEVEKSMQNLQKQLNPNKIQYIKVQEDGVWMKYIPKPES